LVDSTIFDYSKIHGEKYIRDHIQHIYLGTFLFLSKAIHSNKLVLVLWLWKLKSQVRPAGFKHQRHQKYQIKRKSSTQMSSN
jgi:hypothetical protein